MSCLDVERFLDFGVRRADEMEEDHTREQEVESDIYEVLLVDSFFDWVYLYKPRILVISLPFDCDIPKARNCSARH